MSGNGNKFKGNTQKKANRGKKNPYVGLDECDRYAVVERNLGGLHIEVIGLDDRKPVRANIPGKFRKRVWFRKGDVVVITQVIDNIYEIKGKVSETDISKLRGQIEKLDRANGDTKCVIHFGDEDDDFGSDSEDQQDNEDGEDYRPKDRLKNQHKGADRLMRSPEEIAKDNKPKSDEKEDEGDIDFDNI